MSLPFDLVVLDLDGTVLDPHSEAPIHPEVIEAVAETRRRGVRVSLATGRTLEYVARRARDLAIDQPVVTSQGAILGDLASGRVLRERLLEPQVARQVSQWAAAVERVVVMYIRRADGSLQILQNLEQRSPDIYDHWFGTGRVVSRDWSSHLSGACPIKFIVVNHVDEESDLTLELGSRFGPQAHLTRTHPALVEGTAAGVHKGLGLQWLLEHLQIPAERVLVVGDHHNDLPMFALAGTSVAMGQADAVVQEAADWVCPSVDEAGVATALRRFILDA